MKISILEEENQKTKLKRNIRTTKQLYGANLNPFRAKNKTLNNPVNRNKIMVSPVILEFWGKKIYTTR